jgi:host factor-I protein
VKIKNFRGQWGDAPLWGLGQRPKVLKGFTLLEITIVLALWLILSMGVFAVWQHTIGAGAEMQARQNALENARIAMDGIKMNFQMSRRIVLDTDGKQQMVYKHAISTIVPAKPVLIA